MKIKVSIVVSIVPISSIDRVRPFRKQKRSFSRLILVFYLTRFQQKFVPMSLSKIISVASEERSAEYPSGMRAITFAYDTIAIL